MIAHEPAVDPAALRLTLLFLIVLGPTPIYAAVPITCVSVPMLVNRKWCESRLGWALILALLVQHLVLDHLATDNHKYLVTYWVLTVNLSLYWPEVRPRVPQLAQALIGLAFLFAVAWKLIAGESVDASLWEGLLLTDARLTVIARAVGGISQQQQVVNDSAYAALLSSTPAGAHTVRMGSTQALEAAARFIGIVGVGLEAVVAIVFLMPRRLVPQWARLACLLVFFGVYTVLPIVGFAWVLIILAIAHLEPDSEREIAILALAAGLLFGLHSVLETILRGVA